MRQANIGLEPSRRSPVRSCHRGARLKPNVRPIENQMTPETTTIEALRRWSQILLWISVLLPVLGAFAAGARYYVERRANQLAAHLTDSAIQQATEDATAARTELAVLKQKVAPRQLTATQRTAMLPLIEKLKGRPIAFACRMTDGESCDYAAELAAFFLGVGCKVPDPIKTSLNDLPGYVAITTHGQVDPQVVGQLSAVFTAAGIPAKVEPIKENSIGAWYSDVVHVVVGRKAP